MLILTLLLMLPGCGDDGVAADGGFDGGAADGGLDAAPGDAARPDAAGADAAGADAAGADAAGADAGASGETGDPCTDDTDCVAPNDVCLLDTTGSGWEQFPGGYCSFNPCTFGEACGMGGICAPLPGYGPHCFVSCTSDGDCRMAEGYTCQMSAFVPARLCLPPPT